jgi:hypothetical protein
MGITDTFVIRLILNRLAELPEIDLSVTGKIKAYSSEIAQISVQGNAQSTTQGEGRVFSLNLTQEAPPQSQGGDRVGGKGEQTQVFPDNNSRF